MPPNSRVRPCLSPLLCHAAGSAPQHNLMAELGRGPVPHPRLQREQGGGRARWRCPAEPPPGRGAPPHPGQKGVRAPCAGWGSARPGGLQGAGWGWPFKGWPGWQGAHVTFCSRKQRSGSGSFHGSGGGGWGKGPPGTSAGEGQPGRHRRAPCPQRRGSRLGGLGPGAAQPGLCPAEGAGPMVGGGQAPVLRLSHPPLSTAPHPTHSTARSGGSWSHTAPGPPHSHTQHAPCTRPTGQAEKLRHRAE